MHFHSLVFALFLALVWPVWRLLPAAGRGPWLLLASLVFYGWWDWRFLGLLIGSALVDFLCARAIPGAVPGRRRALVLTSVVVNLGVLLAFKYSGFAARELNALGEALGVPLGLPALAMLPPVGLSFYTFQSMAYTIDVARGAAPARRFRDVLLYVSFFPQLVAGPIERASHLLPQLLRLRNPGGADLREAVELITWGFFKKLVVGDNLAPIVQQAFDQPPRSGAAVLLAAYAFTLQIYADFSGYSDMARGFARLFGVELMVNFRRPFFARDPVELWRRWHISLSQWLRDYLYIPLGGSRGGEGRTARNLMITMLLGGLWHGANWTYLVWGGLHGLALVASHRASVREGRRRLPRLMGVLLTFHLTVVAFVFFRAPDLATVGELVRALGQGLQPQAADHAHLRLLLVLGGAVFLWDALAERRGTDLLLDRAPAALRAGVLALLWLLVALFAGAAGQPFLYFQF